MIPRQLHRTYRMDPKRRPAPSSPDADSRSTVQDPGPSGVQDTDPGQVGPDVSQDPGRGAMESGPIEGDNENFRVTLLEAGTAVVLFKGCTTEDEAVAKEAMLVDHGFGPEWDRIAVEPTSEGIEISYECARGLSVAERLAGVENVTKAEKEEAEPAEAAGEAKGDEVARTPTSRRVPVPPERAEVGEHRLTYKERKAMPRSDFAAPEDRKGGKGGYPDENRTHARSALQRVSQFGSPAKKAEVRARVHRDWPKMKIGGVNKESLDARSVVDRLLAESEPKD